MEKVFTMELAGRTLKVTTGKVGKQANGCAFMQYGDTTVMCTATASEKPRDGIDFFPLSVEYEEKFYAAGKISGSKFIKREGKPADEAILVGRLIDRPIRPLFPKGYRQEVQVVCTVLSMDPSFRPDCVAMIAASSALMTTSAEAPAASAGPSPTI